MTKGRGGFGVVRRGALLLIVFLSGAALMAFEMVGSRLLAPYFGNSIFVWGSLIGVFLASLSLGYVIGGRLSDCYPSLDALKRILGGAACLVAGSAWIADPVQRAIVALNLDVRVSAFSAALILFGPASVLLGMVSPFAVRLAAGDLDKLGSTAGTLYGLSTAGSIAGTIVTAFWLIPIMGTRSVVGVIAMGLAGCALVLAVASSKGRGVVSGGALLLAVVTVTAVGRNADQWAAPISYQNWSPTFWVGRFSKPVRASNGQKLRARVESHYHQISVIDAAPVRLMYFNNHVQSSAELRGGGVDTGRVVLGYVKALNLATLYRPGARKVLVVGLGAGSLPMRLRRDDPAMEIDVIELDPRVVELAGQWFGFDDRAIDVTIGDGRSVLARSREKYDLIVMDAYCSESIPFHLVTREFLDVLRSHLTEGGLVAANLIGAVEQPHSHLFRSIYRTYRARFPEVAVHTVGGRAGYGSPDRTRPLDNIIVFASDRPLASYPEIVEAARRTAGDERYRGLDLERFARNRYEAAIRTDDVPILTDDFAPVDALITLSD
jgi:spermidine synthase